MGTVTSRRIATWWLVLALLASQTLGLLHRAVHPAGLSAPASVSTVAPEARGWAQDLFAAHEGDSGCRLYDQLGASGVACASPPVVPFAAPAFFFIWAVAQAPAAFVLRRAARGPPSIR